MNNGVAYLPTIILYCFTGFSQSFFIVKSNTKLHICLICNFYNANASSNNCRTWLLQML